jgi:hypothetical protein
LYINRVELMKASRPFGALPFKKKPRWVVEWCISNPIVILFQRKNVTTKLTYAFA